MIKIDTNEIDKFAVELTELSEKNRDNVQEAIKKSAFNIESQAKKNLASNKSVVTGHLRRSIATKMGDLEATIHTSNVKYAAIVEKGSKAHVIRPKNKKALYWKGVSRPVKLVKHQEAKLSLT